MEPIAIVGLSFKLPQDTTDEAKFWEVLQNRRNLMTKWPEDRMNIDNDHEGGSKTQSISEQLPMSGGHFVKQDPAVFDAPFFSISPAEAAAMDPQQRWALETSYHAFENAGIPVEKLKGSQTAVFGAFTSDDYKLMNCKDLQTMPRTAATGLAASIFTNRISWYFNLLGPSVLVDTACSGTMVALDLACQSIRNGDSSTALVIGSSLLLMPEPAVVLGNMSFLSPDSRCFSFDERANGYARGEGILALVVKPLDDAVRDGDMIRAVIRSTGSNQDGRTPGLTQPSSASQERLIRRVYQKAGLDPGLTRYVEAHGTGTPIGDPIEVQGIGSVFGAYRTPQEPLYVGSVKTNIGHLEGGSGLAGLIKTILALERGIIPPNALLEKLNPDLHADSYNISFPTQPVAWPDGLRRASVNSFGIGGTNSHAVLDDACHFLHERNLEGNHRCQLPSQNGSLVNGSLTNGNGVHDSPEPPRLLVWSAADNKAIQRLIEAYRGFYNISGSSQPHKLDQLAYTLAVRRSLLSWRTFAVVDAATNTTENSGFEVANPVRASSQNDLAFIFSGQGAQYTGMGLALLQYPVFEQTLRRLDGILASLGCTWSLLDEIRSDDHINLPEYSQPLCTALQIGLVELLRTFGIAPTAVVGHSSGEIAAAYAIGALSEASACKVAYYRGQLAGKLKRTTSTAGAMLLVKMSEGDVPAYIASLPPSSVQLDSVKVACDNSPHSCTLSGTERAIDKVKEQLDLDGIFAQKLSTGVAYHSPAMVEIAHSYLDCLGSLEPGLLNPECTMVSTITGQTVAPKLLAKAQYWVENLVSQVKFREALLGLFELQVPGSAITDIVEIGPRTALRHPILDTLNEASLPPERTRPRYHSVLHKARPPMRTLLEVVGQLFCHGHRVSVAEANNQSGISTPLLVDGPQYPFDQSLRYWSEPRVSRDVRMPPHAPDSVLGMPCADWNPLQPRWRNILSMERMPWINDHVVNHTIIIPGAASLVMAIQAVRHHVSLISHISGFLIEDARFLGPIVFDEKVGRTETMLHLRPLREVSNKDPDRFEVQIFTYYDNRWTECFTAKIHTQVEQTQSEVDSGEEERLEAQRISRHYQDTAGRCTKPIDSTSLYDFIADNGISYGSSFRLLSGINWDAQDASVASIRGSSSSQYTAEDFLHPTVLDAALHLSLVQISKGASENMPAVAPMRLFKAWISAKPWKTSSVKVASTTKTSYDGRNFDTDICIVDENGSPLCTYERLTMTKVSESDNSGAEDNSLKVYGVDWQPQLSLLRPSELRELCLSNVTTVKDETATKAFYESCSSALILSLRRTLRELSPEDLRKSPAYISKYLSAVQHFTSQEFSHIDSEDEGYLETLLQQLENERPGWRISSAVARSLRPLILGQVNPLEVFFHDGRAESFYESMFDEVLDARLREYVKLASHERPGLRILEVGAGTGSMTRRVLDILGDLEKEDGVLRFVEYTYTDISPAFFEPAKAKFDDFGDRMRFQKFDLECDALSEGFNETAYDMIFAGSVLHATSDLTATLQNLRKLLKPGGHLGLFEMNPSFQWLNILWGLLPGWWSSTEEWRSQSPLVTERHWDELLKDTGFSGNDLVIRDYESRECNMWNMIFSTALKDPQAVAPLQPRIVLVVNDDSSDQRSLANSVLQGRSGTILPLSDIDGASLTDSDIVVSLMEFNATLVAGMSEQEFYELGRLVQRAQNLLWVTSDSIQSSNFAKLSTMAGFFRTIRTETPHKKIVTLGIESRNGQESPTGYATYVSQVLRATFEDCSSPELEFVVRDGRFTTGRLVRELKVNQDMQSLITPQMRTEPWKPGPALKLDVGTKGLLDTLRFIDDSTFRSQPLAPEDVEIEAKSWPVSFRDLFIALGRMDGEEGLLGLECAGEVTRVGSDCTGVQPGDRVLLVQPGSMRMYPRGHIKTVARIPEGVSFEDAVSAINPAMTAYHSLVGLARLRKGEKVLIHSATGSTGQMALWIAKMIGAEVFATVGHNDKKQLLVDKFDIPADHIFDSRNPTSFARGIMRVTGNSGVDVILNSLAGESLRATWQCIAPYGRFVELGKADISSNASLPMGSFQKNVSFFAVDLQHICRSNLDLTQDLLASVMDLLARKHLQYPAPRHIYSVSDVDKAFRHVQSGRYPGRVVVTANQSDVVPKFTHDYSTWSMDQNATYLIAGGLGGLGRSIVRWMVDKGARNLILLSRSGTSSSSAAAEFVSTLSAQGINTAAPRCDVTSSKEVSAVLKECGRTMPPVKGCINAANDLQDAIFDNMKYTQWERTVRTKVASSWNLHELLPRDLDFFILLSSLTGTEGNPAQSNYAAGCSYQDALAYYRISNGQKAVSFDLGWMRTIGIVAQTERYQQTLDSISDMHAIEEDEFLALLDIYCNPLLPVPPPSKSQLLIGAKTAADDIARGRKPDQRLLRPLHYSFDRVPYGRSGGRAKNAATEDAAALFRRTTVPGKRMEIVTKALMGKLARLLYVAAEDIDENKCPADYGVDSLIAVETRNWITYDFEADITVFDILSGKTIKALTEMIVEKSKLGGQEEE